MSTEEVARSIALATHLYRSGEREENVVSLMRACIYQRYGQSKGSTTCVFLSTDDKILLPCIFLAERVVILAIDE